MREYRGCGVLSAVPLLNYSKSIQLITFPVQIVICTPSIEIVEWEINLPIQDHFASLQADVDKQTDGKNVLVVVIAHWVNMMHGHPGPSLFNSDAAFWWTNTPNRQTLCKRKLFPYLFYIADHSGNAAVNDSQGLDASEAVIFSSVSQHSRSLTSS